MSLPKASIHLSIENPNQSVQSAEAHGGILERQATKTEKSRDSPTGDSPRSFRAKSTRAGEKKENQEESHDPRGKGLDQGSASKKRKESFGEKMIEGSEHHMEPGGSFNKDSPRRTEKQSEEIQRLQTLLKNKQIDMNEYILRINQITKNDRDIRELRVSLDKDKERLRSLETDKKQMMRSLSELEEGKKSLPQAHEVLSSKEWQIKDLRTKNKDLRSKLKRMTSEEYRIFMMTPPPKVQMRAPMYESTSDWNFRTVQKEPHHLDSTAGNNMSHTTLGEEGREFRGTRTSVKGSIHETKGAREGCLRCMELDKKLGEYSEQLYALSREMDELRRWQYAGIQKNPEMQRTIQLLEDTIKNLMEENYQLKEKGFKENYFTPNPKNRLSFPTTEYPSQFMMSGKTEYSFNKDDHEPKEGRPVEEELRREIRALIEANESLEDKLKAKKMGKPLEAGGSEAFNFNYQIDLQEREIRKLKKLNDDLVEANQDLCRDRNILSQKLEKALSETSPKEHFKPHDFKERIHPQEDMIKRLMESEQKHIDLFHQAQKALSALKIEYHRKDDENKQLIDRLGELQNKQTTGHNVSRRLSGEFEAGSFEKSKEEGPEQKEIMELRKTVEGLKQAQRDNSKIIEILTNRLKSSQGSLDIPHGFKEGGPGRTKTYESEEEEYMPNVDSKNFSSSFQEEKCKDRSPKNKEVDRAKEFTEGTRNFKEEFADLLTVNAHLVKNNNELSKKVQDMENELMISNLENKRLKTRLELQEESRGEHFGDEKLKIELRHVKDKNAELEKKLAESKKDCEELAGKLRLVYYEFETLKTKLPELGVMGMREEHKMGRELQGRDPLGKDPHNRETIGMENELKNQISQLEKQNKKAQEEKSQLEKQKHTAEAELSFLAPKYESLMREVKGKDREIAELRHLIQSRENLPSFGSGIEASEEIVKDLSKRNSELELQVLNLKGLEWENKSLKDELSHMSERLGNLQRDMNHLEAEKRGFEMKEKTAGSKMQRKKDRIQRLKNQGAVLSQVVQRKTEECEDLKKKKEHLEREKEGVRKEGERLGESFGLENESLNNELMKKDFEILRLKGVEENLKLSKDECEKLKKECTNMQKVLNQVSNVRDELDKKLQETNKKLKKLEEEGHKLSGEQMAEYKEMKEELDKLRKEKGKTNEFLNKSVDELSKLATVIREKDEEYSKLRQSQSDLKNKAQAVPVLEEQIKKMRDHIDDLERELEEKKSQFLANSKLLEDMEHRGNEKSKSSKKIEEDLRSENANLKEKLKNLFHQIEEMKDPLQELKEKNERYRKSLINAKKHKKLGQEAEKRFSAERLAYETHIMQLKQTLLESEVQNEVLTDENARLKTENSSKRSENAKMYDELARKDTQHSANSEISDLKEKLIRKTRETEEIRGELNLKNGVIEGLKRELKELEVLIEKRKEEHAELLSENQELKKSFGPGKKRANEDMAQHLTKELESAYDLFLLWAL